MGTDEKAIIQALTSISNGQRQHLGAAFKQMYGRNLLEDLKSELSGKLGKVVLALMAPAMYYDARELRAAMKGAGTDEGLTSTYSFSSSSSSFSSSLNVFFFFLFIFFNFFSLFG